MRKGISLIELLVTIIVISVAFPAIFKLFSDMIRNSNRNEVITTATQVASYYLEEIRSKKFDENDIEPYTSWNDLGYDSSTNGLDGISAENSSDHANWDDVDDYNGYSAQYADDPSYSVEIEVFYVEDDDLNTLVQSGTYYKHVKIKVSHVPDIEEEMHTLITPMESL